MKLYRTKYGTVCVAADICEEFGFNREYLRKQGKKLGLGKYLIAVSAPLVGKRHGKVLCITTEGLKHFKKTPAVKYKMTTQGKYVEEEDLIQHFKNKYFVTQGRKYLSTMYDYKTATDLIEHFGDLEKTKDYISWFLDNHEGPQIVSLRYLYHPNKINSYNPLPYAGEFGTVTRDGEIPQELIDCIKYRCPEFAKHQRLRCWNELNGLVESVECYGADNMPVEASVLQIAVEMGYLENINKPRKIK